MNKTDIITIVILSLVVANGASRGLLRSLFGPICLGTALIAGYCTLFMTHNTFTALCIFSLASFLSLWLLNSLFYKWSKGLPPKITFLSRLAGATVNLAWIGSLLAIAFLLVTTLKSSEPQLEATRQLMKASTTCHLLEKYLLGIDTESPPDSSCPTQACEISPAAAQALNADEDIKELLANERLKKVINDPTIRDAIEKKNITQLLSNPSIAEFAQDTQLLAKIIKVYPKLRSKMSPRTAPNT